MEIEKISLAPIHEYTTSPFRLLCEKYGCKLTYVPLVNVSAVVKGGYIPFISWNENTVVQLVGSSHKEFADAIKIIEKKYPFIKGFNINAGCPSYNTVKTGGGSALMRNESELISIIKSCKNSTSLPISVKTRIFPNMKDTLSFYKRLEDADIDFLIIHGRTVKQGYSGFADWEIIKMSKNELTIP
ncbi:MAG: tRNA-dihydrouridine synthase family protein, partial [Candidatus Micrarchaeota archaeon]|nr:tRNA-dihydrouridine synthase family protein [Candidatus Micrarchaeota archaeon]